MNKNRQEDLHTKLWAERVREQQGEVAPAPEWESMEEMSEPDPHTRVGRVHVKRGHTLGIRSLLRSPTVESDYPEDVQRPRTRGECGEERPCPFVSCRYNLYLDVNPKLGSIKLNFPHLEPWEMGESCVLDVAERGGIPGSGVGEGIVLEDVADMMNITRERVRQLERTGMNRIKQNDKKHNSGLHEHAEDAGLGRKVKHLPVIMTIGDEDEDDATDEDADPSSDGT